MSTSSAVLSACGRYRYRLARKLGNGVSVTGIMVNPSTADANCDDPTIRRWTGFATRLGWGQVTIVNKFAWRTPYIADLATASDPTGPENDHYVHEAIAEADIVIAAWGRLAKLPESLQHRWQSISAFCDQSDVKMLCWGINGDGHPKHPLMIPYTSELRPWLTPGH
jgi:hypothetical protein